MASIFDGRARYDVMGRTRRPRIIDTGYVQIPKLRKGVRAF
jgi:hypothetical protein